MVIVFFLINDVKQILDFSDPDNKMAALLTIFYLLAQKCPYFHDVIFNVPFTLGYVAFLSPLGGIPESCKPLKRTPICQDLQFHLATLPTDSDIQ